MPILPSFLSRASCSNKGFFKDLCQDILTERELRFGCRAVELHSFDWRSLVCFRQKNVLNVTGCLGHLSRCLGTSLICTQPWSLVKRHLSLITTDRYVYLLNLVSPLKLEGKCHSSGKTILDKECLQERLELEAGTRGSRDSGNSTRLSFNRFGPDFH